MKLYALREIPAEQMVDVAANRMAGKRNYIERELVEQLMMELVAKKCVTFRYENFPYNDTVRVTASLVVGQEVHVSPTPPDVWWKERI